MSGLVKAKDYNVEDSNVQNIGSALDKDARKEAAATEKAWKGVGQKPGIKVWRIEKFEVKVWPEKQYGEFYKGDSYIILDTYKEQESEELQYHLHFWLGENSTQDEMGTAAYKTVELDNLLDDKPVQYREVQNHESPLFKQYFGSIRYLKGGVDSGFKHVETNEEPPQKMFQFCGNSEKNVTCDEVEKPSWESLNSHEVFVIVGGLSIIKFHGSKCNMFERWDANKFLKEYKSAHPRVNQEIVIDGDEELNSIVVNYLRKKNDDEQKQGQEQHQEEGEEQEQEQGGDEDDTQTNQFIELLVSFLGVPPEDFDVSNNNTEENFNKKKEAPCEKGFVKKLIRVEHDRRTAKVEMETVASGDDITSYDLDENFCYILDKGKEVFGYAGKQVDKKNKNSLMVYCNRYLSDKVNKNAPLMAVKSAKKFEERMKA